MDTCVGVTRKKPLVMPKVMRLRPVLEHRMPTLATKAAFTLKPNDQSAIPLPRHSRKHSDAPQGLLQLQGAPPRSMRDVRAAVTKELKSVTRKLARLEREYYGERGTVYAEVERYTYPVKTLMKTLWIVDLNKASEVEELIRQSTNPERYKKDPSLPVALKEVFTKIQNYLPDKVSVLVETCQSLLNHINRYCVSFYEADTDCYLETPAHYAEQIAVWKTKAEHSIQAARTLYRKFCTTGITMSMLSSPVATFSSRADISKLLFLVMFADACTHIRSALSVLSLWMKTDETYATYVKNDVAELEKQKEDKMKILREVRQRCHSLTYSLTKVEADHSRLSQAVDSTKDKENNLRIEEVSLVNLLNDLDLEIEFKEKRRDNLKRRSLSTDHSSSDTAASSSAAAAVVAVPLWETCESLNSELKSLRERQAAAFRALSQVRCKLAQVNIKLDLLSKATKDMKHTRKELHLAEEERHLREQEFLETEEAIQLARRILLCKTATDATEKLYYRVPFGTKNCKGQDKDPIRQAFKIISARIDNGWVSLYRHLPFYPHRGEETIEQDIVHIRDRGARASPEQLSAHALERWKRYHTRANVQDLRQALRQVKRFDILKAIDEDLKSPGEKERREEDPFEPEEQLAPPVKPELLPFYRLVERYDQLRASGKVKQ